MYKFLAPLFLGIFTVISTPQAQAADKDVYRVNCLPEVGVMEIKRYSTGGKGQVSYFAEPADMEQKGYHNPLWQQGRPDMYQHQCVIHGQQVLVKMDALSYTEEKHGRPCAWDKQSILRINAWVDGEQVIDNLRFNGGCTKSKAFLGDSIYGITIYPRPEAYKEHAYQADVNINLDLAGKDLYFGIKYNPPYKEGNSLSKGVPLSNADVHGADIEKNFPPDLQAP
ncbi:MAG: hypothetical protein CMF62_08960 [Magnetococcales bacterium]|nr:hypothetical protein [Magnetococcales bacterium]|tara:strand:+ start:499806 stop:500480 length:675 start_codon:yes stop_codon:yes gene_type:complete